MKNINKIFALLALLNCSVLYAQTDWLPIGAKWSYTLKYASSSGEDYNILESIKDTIINTINCKKISRLTTTCDGRSQFEYMYENNNSIYFYDGYSDKFNLLYDFNKNTGESWYIQVNENGINSDSLFVQVDSISAIIVNGVSLKVLNVTISNNDNWVGHSGKITEKFGHNRNMFPYTSRSCDIKFNIGLRCYEDLSFGNFQSGIAPSCSYSNVGIEDVILDSGFKLYPIPAMDCVCFDNFNDLQLVVKIYNINGVLEKTVITNSNKVNIQDLSKGFYFITFSNTDGKLINKCKFIK